MKNVGIDIVEIKRIKKILNDKFLSYVLSKEELELYRNYSGERAYQFIAGRFAAKEAVIKALSGECLFNMKDISILNNSDGMPVVVLDRYEIKLSISHEKEYAVAIAIWE